MMTRPAREPARAGGFGRAGGAGGSRALGTTRGVGIFVSTCAGGSRVIGATRGGISVHSTLWM